MNVLRIIKSVRKLLFQNKLRVALSLIGISIGISSVIILVAVGEGAKARMLFQIEKMGKNIITIDAGKVKEVMGRRRQLNKITSLKEKDCIAINDELGGIILTAPTQDKTLLIKHGNGATTARVIGTSSEYPEIRNYKVALGRFFSEEDNTTALRVAVIGQKVMLNLFGTASPIGEMIKINNVSFEVIGTLEPKGASYDGANEDEVILIPLKTGMRRLYNVDYIKNIYVQVKNKKEIKSVESSIRTILRERHRLDIRSQEDDFTLQNMNTVLTAENDTDKLFTSMIIGVAVLSLIVGSIGILAVMLLSVKERSREIGLRIAVGAKSKDILIQFLFEAVILSFSGGMIGIVIGFIGTFMLDKFTGIYSIINVQSIFISGIVSVAIGVFFGVYPAIRASMVEPIQALKG
jgi:putative ABC transport system permease protein